VLPLVFLPFRIHVGISTAFGGFQDFPPENMGISPDIAFRLARLQSPKNAGADWQIRAPDGKGGGHRASALGGIANSKSRGNHGKRKPFRRAGDYQFNVRSRGASAFGGTEGPSEFVSPRGLLSACEESKFAVGLELAVRVEEWQKPPRP